MPWTEAIIIIVLKIFVGYVGDEANAEATIELDQEIEGPAGEEAEWTEVSRLRE